RRLTRFSRDWSSVVCSSDLRTDQGTLRRHSWHGSPGVRNHPRAVGGVLAEWSGHADEEPRPARAGEGEGGVMLEVKSLTKRFSEIGRASCRERRTASG